MYIFYIFCSKFCINGAEIEQNVNGKTSDKTFLCNPTKLKKGVDFEEKVLYYKQARLHKDMR